MMKNSINIDAFAKRMVDAFRAKEYAKLDLIMKDIFLLEDKLQLLVDLSNRVPGLVLESLYLRGLSYLMNFELNDFRDLYKFSKGNDIAIYEFTRFLISHAEVNKQILRNLCTDFDEIEGIDQFAFYFREGNGISSNTNRMNDLIYRDYGISAESISLFKKKFAKFRTEMVITAEINQNP